MIYTSISKLLLLLFWGFFFFQPKHANVPNLATLTGAFTRHMDKNKHPDKNKTLALLWQLAHQV